MCVWWLVVVGVAIYRGCAKEDGVYEEMGGAEEGKKGLRVRIKDLEGSTKGKSNKQNKRG